jgi:hypothetical protein
MAVIRIKNKDTPNGVPSGLTQGELAVNLSDRSLYVGGTVGNSIFISGVQSFNGATGDVLGAGLAGNTFTGLNHFQAGISAAGATIGTLIVHRGISASGGATFDGFVNVVGGISAAGATIGTLIVHNGISASGGVTFHNTLYVGQTLSFGGNLVNPEGYVVSTILSIGTTGDFPEDAVTGDIVFVRGPVPTQDGIYFYNGSVWVKLTPAYNPADTNGDGVVDGVDLATILAGWSSNYSINNFTNPDPGITRAKFEIGLEDLYDDSFEIKVFGASGETNKKTSILKITTDDAVPQIFMKAGTVEMDSDLKIYPMGDYTTTIKQTGFMETGYLHVLGSTAGGKGSTYDGNVYVGGLLTLNGGLSAGCGVTFNCLVDFTAGLSASGATLGTLLVNGGSTFNGPVYMGATLTMNSNIRFNPGYGITGGFIDAGWY